jgi:hypothetical protein
MKQNTKRLRFSPLAAFHKVKVERGLPVISTDNDRVRDFPQAPDSCRGFQVDKQVQAIRHKVNHAFNLGCSDFSENRNLRLVANAETLGVVLGLNTCSQPEAVRMSASVAIMRPISRWSSRHSCAAFVRKSGKGDTAAMSVSAVSGSRIAEWISVPKSIAFVTSLPDECLHL